MTPDEFLDKQFHISVTAGMNQRYHQQTAHRWEWWDRWAKIAVGILAVAGLCLTFATLGATSWWLLGIDIFVAVAGMIAAVALNLVPLGDWASRHNALFQRWTDMREDVDALLFDFQDDATDSLVDRLKDLEAKLHRICGTEPQADDGVLRGCYDKEVKSRDREPQLVS